MSELSLSNPFLWEFINIHSKDIPEKLRLKYSDKHNEHFDYSFAIDQIEARNKVRTKLRNTIQISQFLFPSPLIAEQASSDDIALFHSSIIGGAKTVLDMTAGLCIDAMHMAKAGATVTALDINPLNVEIGRHNATVSGIKSLSIHNIDSAEFVRITDCRFDIVFADPARRNTTKGKRVYSLQDSSPDIVALLPRLRKISQRLLVKSSPMIDITDTLRRIPCTQEIFVVSLNGECKEILIDADLSIDKCNSPRITAVDIKPDQDAKRLISIRLDTENNHEIPLADEKDIEKAHYLYEPAAAVMKIGAPAFVEIARQFPCLRKLHPNTHVFISPSSVQSFPGRTHMIDKIITLRDPIVKTLKGNKINTVCRNFGMTPEELKKRLKISDGGSQFLYAVNTTVGHRLIITE